MLDGLTPQDKDTVIYFLVAAVFLLAVPICLKAIDDFFGGLVSKFFENIPQMIPWAFKGWKSFSKFWLKKYQKYVVSRDIKNTTGFSIPIDIEFVEASKVKTVKNGKRLIVMYNPSEHPDENFANIVLAVSENCIPNSQKIIDKDLRKCIKYSLAKEIVETKGNEKTREFAAKHLFKGDANVLTSNPYFSKIDAISKKRLFSRLYIHTLSIFGDSFDTQRTPVELKQTVQNITDKVSKVAADFMENEIPHLMLPSDPNFEDGYEYFFRENGLAVNLMFTRSQNHFNREDISRYATKAKALLERGMQINYLICGGFSMRSVDRKTYLKRVEFAEKIAKELNKIPGLELVSETKQPLIQHGNEYPIYIAIFKKK